MTKPSNATPRRQLIAPYVTAWSAEQDPPHELIALPGVGIAYADETMADRDRNGVLWNRTPSRPGQGCPDFGRVHPHRQRRAMLRLLCQVCAGPADHTDKGVLWLLKDHRADWPDWPNRMGVTEPPICLPCVRTSIYRCPALRKGAVTVRARHYPIAGVHGALHTGPRLATTDVVTVPLVDPTIRWVRAVSLVRELNECTVDALYEIVN
jgi:hypothetical protein